jgi:hypothetical protein
MPCPFIPLLLFFQRGGTFTSEHKVFIQINGCVTVHSEVIASTVQKPILELSSKALDELDEALKSQTK